MNSLTIDAIYQNGVLKPSVKLDLPENASVTLKITSLNPLSSATLKFSSLRGILSDVEISPSLEVALQQSRLLTGNKLEQAVKELLDD